MEIKIINKIEDLVLIKKDWDELFSKGEYSIFQSFDFCYNSASIKNSKLFVITMQANAELVEIWPCQLVNKKLRFINDSHADFCDILSSL